jgi:hypothetical protein
VVALSIQVPKLVQCRSYSHGGVVLLNLATGRWHALNGSAGMLWRAWQSGASFEQAVAAVARRHPAVSPDRIRADAGQLLDQLVARGLLRIQLPDRAAAVAMAAPEPAGAPARLADRALALGCLALALVGTRLPFRTTHRLVRLTRRRGHRAPAQRRASSIVAAVRWAARWYPGRAACLELSLAAVLLAALLGLRLDWCLGAAADPYRFHAWVEVAGVPVPSPGDIEQQAPFAAVLVV